MYLLTVTYGDGLKVKLTRREYIRWRYDVSSTGSNIGMVFNNVVVQIILACEHLVTELTLDLVGRVHEHVTRHDPARGKRLTARRAREALWAWRHRAALLAYVEWGFAEEWLVAEWRGLVGEAGVRREDGLFRGGGDVEVAFHRVPLADVILQQTDTHQVTHTYIAA